MVFKIISTIAVGLIMTTWAFQNSKFINDFIVSKLGGNPPKEPESVVESEPVVEESVESTATAVETAPVTEESTESSPVVIVKKGKK